MAFSSASFSVAGFSVAAFAFGEPAPQYSDKGRLRIASALLQPDLGRLGATPVSDDVERIGQPGLGDQPSRVGAINLRLALRLGRTWLRKRN